MVHDTTEVAPKRSKPPEDMGYIKGGQRGVLLQASLVVEEEFPSLPLGLLSYEFYHRPAPSKKKKPANKKKK